MADFPVTISFSTDQDLNHVFSFNNADGTPWVIAGVGTWSILLTRWLGNGETINFPATNFLLQAGITSNSLQMFASQANISGVFPVGAEFRGTLILTYTTSLGTQKDAWGVFAFKRTPYPEVQEQINPSAVTITPVT